MRFITRPLNVKAKNPSTFIIVDTLNNKTVLRITSKVVADKIALKFNDNNSPKFK